MGLPTHAPAGQATSAEVSEAGPGPQQASDYAANTTDRRCAPSCYTPEPAEHPLDPVRGCGYRIYLAREVKTGPTTWGGLELGGSISFDPHAVPYPCDQFPAPQPAWKAELAAARPLLQTKPGDVVVAEPTQTDWMFETNELEQVVSRDLQLREFMHDVETRPSPCAGGKDPLVFCEKSRSRAATAMNAASYHLAEADKLAKAGKKNGCRQAAWNAAAYVASARQTRADGLAKKSWIPSARYELRDGRVLDEAALFKALDAAEAQAKQLFASCGGTGDPPLTDRDRYLDGEALKRQMERGPDGVARHKMW